MDPATTASPLTGNRTVDLVLAILGALVPLFSLLSAALNAWIRRAPTDKPASPGVLRAASLANVVAVNLDKAWQLAQIASGKPTASTVKAPVPVAEASSKPVDSILAVGAPAPGSADPKP